MISRNNYNCLIKKDELKYKKKSGFIFSTFFKIFFPLVLFALYNILIQINSKLNKQIDAYSSYKHNQKNSRQMSEHLRHHHISNISSRPLSSDLNDYSIEDEEVMNIFNNNMMNNNNLNDNSTNVNNVENRTIDELKNSFINNFGNKDELNKINEEEYDKLSDEEINDKLDKLDEYVSKKDMYIIWYNYSNNSRKKYYNMIDNVWARFESLCSFHNIPNKILFKLWNKAYNDLICTLHNKDYISMKKFYELFDKDECPRNDFIQFIDILGESWYNLINKMEKKWNKILQNNIIKGK
ncbi:exported protein (PHISTc) [Plasmodium gaboni]|uniref:Exported protein (PHISTc) n=1 Tax=Plasmodium gaboni TaxID=647221 RepID=A0A151LWS5_9APIC|nr:exported protein (PHISTc) [Plasmodium gaboni]KYO03626.1 exported protein (PHISTc) [Plasmodium gaboni]SOV20188.1 Plasmodium exported protein (PHISTc), unknown function [Plasmodium gaboni]SOV20753.1 Plasmodium exported protein (PHISTc), unknown function [Plasmodium sp. DRC-Itaito]